MTRFKKFSLVMEMLKICQWVKFDGNCLLSDSSQHKIHWKFMFEGELIPSYVNCLFCVVKLNSDSLLKGNSLPQTKNSSCRNSLIFFANVFPKSNFDAWTGAWDGTFNLTTSYRRDPDISRPFGTKKDILRSVRYVKEVKETVTKSMMIILRIQNISALI